VALLHIQLTHACVRFCAVCAVCAVCAAAGPTDEEKTLDELVELSGVSAREVRPLCSSLPLQLALALALALAAARKRTLRRLASALELNAAWRWFCWGLIDCRSVAPWSTGWRSTCCARF